MIRVQGIETQNMGSDISGKVMIKQLFNSSIRARTKSSKTNHLHKKVTQEEDSNERVIITKMYQQDGTDNGPSTRTGRAAPIFPKNLELL
ncbi:hypothetical protein MKW98_002983, partial [Papaver atlanticum]